MTGQSIPDAIQTLIAAGIFLLAFAGPLVYVARLYRRPSFLYQRLWCVGLVLVLAALVVPVFGYGVIAILTKAFNAAGWYLFFGDSGFRALFALAGAAGLLLITGIGVGIMSIINNFSTGKT